MFFDLLEISTEAAMEEVRLRQSSERPFRSDSTQRPVLKEVTVGPSALWGAGKSQWHL